MSEISDKIMTGKKARSAKLLLVIDEAKNLGRCRKFLRAQGHQVVACRSYKRGLELLGRETFDLVAVSQGGEAFEGKEVLMRALEANRSTPVLVLTRAPDRANHLEAMQLGAVEYLEMPVPPVELLRVLRTHVHYNPAA